MAARHRAWFPALHCAQGIRDREVVAIKTVVGVMGGASGSEATLSAAYQLGALIARAGWVLLNGGRDAGVMAASARGAAELGGLVIGVLPGDDWDGIAPHVDIPVITGMGDARNAINVLSSRVVLALPGGAGTLSEIALALKAGRPVVTVGFPLGERFSPFYSTGALVDADTPQEAVAAVQRFLGDPPPARRSKER